MKLIEATIVLVLATWLVATIVYQIFGARLRGFIRRWDIFRWLPAYDLFSGTPRDLRLYYRDLLPAGELTAWQEVALCSNHKWIHALWHPRDRALEVIGSLVDDLARILEQVSDQAGRKPVTERFVYLSILRIVLRPPHAAESTGRQFKIEETEGAPASESKTIFCSGFHPYEFVFGS